MANSSADGSLGSLGRVSLIAPPPLPTLIAEWAAIVPLICNLADQRDDYNTIGDVALRGRLFVGLFPRLGTLAGLSRLLGGGKQYLDHASNKGGSSRTVWDVNWGSVFPCANGAVVHTISEYLLAGTQSRVRRMPETCINEARGVDSKKPSIHADKSAGSAHTAYRRESSTSRVEGQDSIRRSQTLHVYRMKRKRIARESQRDIRGVVSSLPCQILKYVVLTGLATFLVLVGCYGTAALVVCSTTSSAVAQTINVRRPWGYLRNNEDHSACMLVAAHENAVEWHLYIGDRAVVDTILNKPMFGIASDAATRYAARWFWVAHLLQLAAMTFVAAQKGWDGVCMVLLLIGQWASSSFHSSRALCVEWLKTEGVDAEVKSFEFSGRSGMMGAIQLFSQSTVTRWMDTILVPHPRREVWLERLTGGTDDVNLSSHDEIWTKNMTDVSRVSAAVLQEEFSEEHATMSVEVKV
ncbi:uncharacterized protein AB675_638 [Cyphellophora attinorum]|uniref:Uncharacterized protein n=1 Tax=Cyphellophora attinorum TaxID=1664694 RepID=A0A0N1HBB8_9EURO|nr:uncharacterized protein AB675_638 [Phialophora attinorum]KPI45450.1 hypothetical protein AB675_638 [Phialophora attinorum]